MAVAGFCSGKAMAQGSGVPVIATEDQDKEHNRQPPARSEARTAGCGGAIPSGSYVTPGQCLTGWTKVKPIRAFAGAASRPIRSLKNYSAQCQWVSGPC